MHHAKARFGFTLLEMMVVLVLLGLLTTLALPAVQRWHDGVQVRSQIASVVEALRAAAFAAPASRKLLVMDRASFEPAPPPAAAAPAGSTSAAPGAVDPRLLRLPLPAGWKAERVARAEFRPNGLCQPGYAALRTERGAPVLIEVQGPLCAVDSRNAEAPR